jgi:toxin FitB
MTILDTNVISALMLERPDLAVVRWLNRQPRTSVWSTVISIFEIRGGLLTMPAGRRQSQRIAAFEQILAGVIEDRLAVFDQAAAEKAAELASEREKRGRPGDLRDTMIAGIVLASHAVLATRNVKHFADIAKSVVSPWEA